jgi:transcriptional regulator with XRE-family HTH domain
MTLGQQIKERRRALRIDRETLCNDCNLSVRALYYLESDTRFPTNKTISKLCEALKVEIILKPKK